MIPLTLSVAKRVLIANNCCLFSLLLLVFFTLAALLVRPQCITIQLQSAPLATPRINPLNIYRIQRDSN